MVLRVAFDGRFFGRLLEGICGLLFGGSSSGSLIVAGKSQFDAILNCGNLANLVVEVEDSFEELLAKIQPASS
jgi:hypothetical protein